VKKPSLRQLISARNTLVQVTLWAELDGQQRDDIGSVVYILNQIEDSEIGPDPNDRWRSK
jgi:hypothetical protein